MDYFIMLIDYINNTITIYNSNLYDVLPTLPSGSIDSVICDPPFGITSVKWDKSLDWDFIWKELDRVCKYNANKVFFSQGIFMAELIMSNKKEFKYDLVWNKNKCGSPGLAHYRPQKVHENILVFNKGVGTYNPIMEKGTPYSRVCKDKNKGYGTGKNNHNYGFGTFLESHNSGTRFPKSILFCPRDFSAQQQVHPTQKPVDLLQWLVKTYTNEGDTVLDFTMGSGTTGVACKSLNRNFIGIELDSTYYNIAKDRINNLNISTDIKVSTQHTK